MIVKATAPFLLASRWLNAQCEAWRGSTILTGHISPGILTREGRMTEHRGRVGDHTKVMGTLLPPVNYFV
jgi:hypothetical protein